MKTEFKAKFLQTLNRKKKEGGFTLIELLVVIVIIGILAAIALPSFLNQASKAKQSEAKNNVGAVNRSQQAYYLENQDFATDFEPLKIGIPTLTENYEYDINSTPNSGKADIKATPQKNALLAYAGLVQVDKGQTFAAACQSKAPDGAAKATPPAINSATGTPEANCSAGEPMK